jgi:AcrR family transcriptional regulator
MDDGRPFYIRAQDPPAKRAILRAAMKLLSERGMDATSIRDIARESGFSNPALYRHFSTKEDLALHLFELCHRRVWASGAQALASSSGFERKLDRYFDYWLSLVDEHPDIVAFLSESERVLWPKMGPAARRRNMIALARSLMLEVPAPQPAFDPDLAAACLHGTLNELARLLREGRIDGPASRWKSGLMTLFQGLSIVSRTYT